MSELVNCRHCGAANPSDAEWCGQCFGTLEGDPPPDESNSSEPLPRRTGWECRACGTENPVAASVCSACGTSIYESYGADGEDSAVDPERAIRRSLMFPGLGYGSLNLAGIGAVAGFLAVASVVVGTMLVIAGEVIGIALIVVFLALWGLSVVDVSRLAGGEARPLLRPRVLSIVGGGVVVLLLVTVAIAFQSATS